MPAYVIYIREETHDQSELDTYSALVGPILAKLPIKILAALGKLETLEGPVPESVTVVEFASMEAAYAWYRSPEYQAAAQHRFKGATYRGLIVEGTSPELNGGVG
jgi:uncharacterized protein (DUF1330 family)